MTGRSISILAVFVLLLPQAQASVVKEMVELPNCRLQIGIIKPSTVTSGPRFIMMDGVPLSGAVFQNLGDQLSMRPDATSMLIGVLSCISQASRPGVNGHSASPGCLMLRGSFVPIYT